MPWTNVQRKAADDTKITDKQRREIVRLQEQLDRVPEGTYSGNTYALTSREASRYLEELQARIDRRHHL